MTRSSPTDDTDDSNSGSQVGQSTTTAPTIIDTACDVLAHRDRRAIVGYFMATDSTSAGVTELAEYARQEELHELDRETCDCLLSLHHFHLPKLADAGIIEYDSRGNTVRYRGGDILEEFMNAVYSD